MLVVTLQQFGWNTATIILFYFSVAGARWPALHDASELTSRLCFSTEYAVPWLTSLPLAVGPEFSLHSTADFSSFLGVACRVLFPTVLD